MAVDSGGVGGFGKVGKRNCCSCDSGGGGSDGGGGAGSGACTVPAFNGMAISTGGSGVSCCSIFTNELG